jgi:hypothetical protein
MNELRLIILLFVSFIVSHDLSPTLILEYIRDAPYQDRYDQQG